MPPFDAAVDRHIQRIEERERRDARRAARSRCRARTLLEAAEQLLGTAEEGPSPAALGRLTLRPMSALELGLTYAWMAADERSAADSDGEERATRWWSGGAVGIQQAWEAATGWFDEALDEPPSSSTSWPAGASIDAVAQRVAEDGRDMDTLLGCATARDCCSPPPHGPHVLGAFADGHCAPIGFVATRAGEGDGAMAASWVIDAMGTRVSSRGHGVGTALAEHCMNAARAAGADEYRIDVVPSAVRFWRRLGFDEVEASGEQQFFMARGGDRPMAKRLCEAAGDNSGSCVDGPGGRRVRAME